jgi:hypothetical protein
VTQITRAGGHAAVELPEGRGLIYQKARSGATEGDLWLLPAGDRQERRLPARAPIGAFAVVTDGIYFIRWVEGQSELWFYRFDPGTVVRSETIEGRVEDLEFSPDRTTILFTRIAREQGDLMLVDGFR